MVNTLGEFRKGTTVADAHGTFTVTLKDGFVTRSELHLTGTVTTAKGSKAVDRKEVFSFSDYDATRPDVPDAAKQALANRP